MVILIGSALYIAFAVFVLALMRSARRGDDLAARYLADLDRKDSE
jgi:hypothetical protein